MVKTQSSEALHKVGLSSSLRMWKAGSGADLDVDSYKESRFFMEFCGEGLIQK